MKEADTDTTVVPRGVVAAMKALREQQGTPQGMPGFLNFMFTVL